MSIKEYTLGTDGFHYVCEHDITNKSDPERGVIYRHQIETAFHLEERTECAEELLAWIEKENEVYELHKSFSLEKKRGLLFMALALDKGLYERLAAEKRIPDNSLEKISEMSEEDVDSLMSYLRFTESLCSAICIYDDVFALEESQSEPDVRIGGILIEHGEDDYGFWEGFYLTKSEESTIWKILNRHSAEGCSVRGTKKEIAEEMTGVSVSAEGRLTNEELLMLSEGMLALIRDVNEAAKLVPAGSSNGVLRDLAKKYQELNAKICSMAE